MLLLLVIVVDAGAFVPSDVLNPRVDLHPRWLDTRNRNLATLHCS